MPSLDPERLSSSLEAALVRLPRIAAVRRLGSAEKALESAEAAGFDLIVEARVSAVSDPALVRVERRITAAASGRVLEEASEDVLSPTENELSQTFWLALSSAVEKNLSAAAMDSRRPAASSAPAAERPRPWTTDIGAYMAQFPDFWTGWSFLDNRLSVKVGFYQFLIGVYFGSASSDTTFHSVYRTLFQPG